jgi:tRNA A37 threonylcarbamoyladenosine dehydratase
MIDLYLSDNVAHYIYYNQKPIDRTGRQKMLNEFSRTELLIGIQALRRLGQCRVAVFGIGGVGSFATEALTRAGVGNLVLVDNDLVDITNLNRQIHATHETIGQPKVEVMKKRILSINPRANVDTYQQFYLPDNAESLLSQDYDYIIDAVDTVTAKIDLVVRAQHKGIPIVSSMGTGNKLNPASLEIADIYQTSVCPLAKVMRHELRKRDIKALKVVYSREEPITPGNLPTECTPEPGSKRRQIPGSISFVPPVAGLLLASEVIKDILKK